VHSILHKS